MTTFPDKLFELGGVPVGGFFADTDASVFCVDPSNGSDGNTGTYDNPVATLSQALSLCTSGNGDIIVRMPGGEEVSSTVTVNVSGVTIIASHQGLNPLAKGEYYSMYAASTFTDGPVLQITARCTIIGMAFAGRDTGATFYNGAAVLIGGLASAAPFGVHILGCRFPKWGLDNRIGIGIEGSSDTLIEACSFEGVGASFDSGIYAQGAGLQNLEVSHCRFRQCTYAITHGSMGDGGGPHCLYVGNYCEDSKLLDSGGNTATGLIAGNYLETATDATSYDGTVDTLNGYGLNFAGNNYAE